MASTNGTDQPPTAHVADTGFFAACGGPENDKFQTITAIAKQKDVTILCPPRVMDEIKTGAGAYSAKRRSVDVAIEDGWVEVQEISHTLGPISNAMDQAQRHIANITGREEHVIEKADVAVIGLAVEILISDTADRVRVYSTDRALMRAGKKVTEQDTFHDHLEFIDVFEYIRSNDIKHLLLGAPPADSI